MKIDVFKLEEAILANVCQPKREELKKFSFEKRLRASPSLEGNSQFGIILFIGVARKVGIPKEEIINHLSIDNSEYLYKFGQFQKMEDEGVWVNITNDNGGDVIINRFENKVKLILNYLKLNN